MRTPRFAFVAVAAATALVLAACNGDEDGGGDAAEPTTEETTPAFEAGTIGRIHPWAIGVIGVVVLLFGAKKASRACPRTRSEFGRV